MVNGVDAEEQTEEETTTTDSPAEKEEEKENPSQEGDESDESEDNTEDTKDDNTSDETNIPFHKHPRWKKMKQELDELRTLKESLNQKTTEDAPRAKEDEDTSLPQWVLDLTGGQVTPEAQQFYKNYLKENNSMRKSLKDEVLKEIQSEQTQQQAEEAKWNKWIDDEVERLEDDGHKFNKNELLKVANEFQPVDSKGNISLDKALQILQLQKVKKDEGVEARKKIAGENKKGGGQEETPKTFTPHMLRNSLLD